MAEPIGFNMIAKILGQIYNLHELVRIGNDVYKLDKKDGKYRNKAGKTWTRPQLIDYVKGQQYKAPNVPKPNSKLKVKTTPKPTTTKTNPLQIGMNKLNQFTQNQQYNQGKNTINPKRTDGKLRFGVDSGAMTKDGMTRGTRATVNNMMPGRKGGTIPTMIAGSLLGEEGLDPGGKFGNWLVNRVAPGPDKTLEENNALRAQLLAEKEINKQNKKLMIKTTGGIENPQQTGGAIGRSRQDPYLNRPEPTQKKKTTSTNYVQTPSPTWKGEDKPKDKVKSKKKESKKSGKSEEQIAWEKKSKNSPARKSGAFTDKELWEQYKKHQKWLKKNNRLKVSN